MGFFDVDYSKAEEEKNNLFPAGIYEMTTNQVTMDASRNGHQCMQFEFIVRKDLDKVKELSDTNSKCHGRHYWANVWTEKDDNGNDTGTFKKTDLNNIAKAYGIPDHTPIESADQFMNMLVGKPVRIKILLRKNKYNGQETDQNSTFCSSWEPTKFQAKGAGAAKLADPFNGTGDTTDVSDDDLPF